MLLLLNHGLSMHKYSCCKHFFKWLNYYIIRAGKLQVQIKCKYYLIQLDMDYAQRIFGYQIHTYIYVSICFEFTQWTKQCNSRQFYSIFTFSVFSYHLVIQNILIIRDLNNHAMEDVGKIIIPMMFAIVIPNAKISTIAVMILKAFVSLVKTGVD